jgi:DNA modification methylase
VVPLHASIQERCRKIGFDNLATIIWHKIANATLEATGNGGGFLGKPYEPNAVIKNDIEFLLMERKPGGYRSPDFLERAFSVIPDDLHKIWFRQIWADIPGASTREHPAPFPMELAIRLIRMFSFVGDTVLDPFLGSGTTAMAAWQTGRNSIGVEVDTAYLKHAVRRFSNHADTLLSHHKLDVIK